jgi:positive regulator of sigma E activity
MSYVYDLREQGINAAPHRCKAKSPCEGHTCEEQRGHSGPHHFVRPFWTKTNPGQVVEWKTPA